jgi:cobyrinic acid a,c-diamide synthase
MNRPKIVMAASRGGSGKTLLTIGIIAAWSDEGFRISPFKKGPDYIDAGWLAMAAGRPCYNLDTFLIDSEQVLSSFLNHSQDSDIAVVEGNRGLYDGLDFKGSTSTAKLAKLIEAPVVLIINSTKTTRTMAAVVSGCIQFDADVKIEGVILNRVAGPRHEAILRKSIEHYCGIPVVGAVPKLSQQNFPERHMGLIPTPEHAWAKTSIQEASKLAEKYLDLDALKQIAGLKLTGLAAKGKKARSASAKKSVNVITLGEKIFSAKLKSTLKIGIIRDSAFQFYYPENIDALKAAGADICFISPLHQSAIPDVDAVYIGGGFPETHAEALADNVAFKQDLKAQVETGLPIYAECGGLMYLGDELVLDDTVYPMAGVLPVAFGLSKRPQGHGYTIIKVESENPFFKVGLEIRGHEFHYSKVLRWDGNDKDLAFCMKRGTGFLNNRDGICYKNVLATYTHIHALGTPSWAIAMIRNAASHQRRKAGRTTGNR